MAKQGETLTLKDWFDISPDIGVTIATDRLFVACVKHLLVAPAERFTTIKPLAKWVMYACEGQEWSDQKLSYEMLHAIQFIQDPENCITRALSSSELP